MAVVVLALLAAASAPKAKVDFKPLRRVTTLPVNKCDVLVTFRLTVDDGGSEDHYCPKVVFEWEDGTRSMEASDCVPFDKAAAGDHKKTWTRSRTFHTTGTYHVRAHLCQAERRIQSIETIAVVAGWEGYPSEERAKYGCAPSHLDGMGETGQAGEMDVQRLPSIKDPCAEEEGAFE